MKVEVSISLDDTPKKPRLIISEIGHEVAIEHDGGYTVLNLSTGDARPHLHIQGDWRYLDRGSKITLTQE